MGQSKQLGSREDRMTTATFERMATLLSDVRKQMGLPKNAEFLGCVVNICDTDEYLAVLEDDGATIRRGYVLSPAKALRFESREDADVVAASLPKRSVSGLLFDLGDQYFVAFDS